MPYILSLTLIFGAVAAALSAPAYAASTRSAVVVSLSGDVTVKKAGGERTFSAYENMTLNQGDHISTGAGSSVVLQVVDHEDEVTIGENSELYISDLTDKGDGKKTGFKVWAGNVWTKVKKLTNEDDSFNVETPTAVMGVHGTQFFIGVDPQTGNLSLMVAAGEVGANTEDNGDSSESSDEISILPTQQLSLLGSGGDSSSYVTPVDLDEFVKNASPAIIEALVKNKQALDEENEQYLAEQKRKLEEEGPSSSTIKDLDTLNKLSDNLSNLIGNVVNKAIEQNKVDKDQIQKVIDEVNESLGDAGKKLDLSDVKPYDPAVGLDPDEAKKQQEALEKAKAEQQQKLEEEKQKQEELKQQNAELVEQLKEQQQKQKEDQAKAEEEQQKQAEDSYKESLPESEQQSFDAAKQKLDESKSQSTDASTAQPGSDEDSPGDSSGDTVVRVTGVTVKDSSTPLTLAVGSTSRLAATVAPANAANQAVTWKSGNTGAATVSASGLVTAVAAGTATITVATVDGGKTASREIIVKVPVAGVIVSPQSVDLVVGGSPVYLTATVSPDAATNQAVTWSSDNPSVATVNADTGKVAAVAVGTAHITATSADDSGKFASSTVVVGTAIVPATGVSVNPAEAVLDVGGTAALAAAVAPANATNRAVVWSSADIDVATVDPNTGVVTATGAGTATITATTVDGSNKSASSIIKVKGIALTGDYSDASPLIAGAKLENFSSEDLAKIYALELHFVFDPTLTFVSDEGTVTYNQQPPSAQSHIAENIKAVSGTVDGLQKTELIYTLTGFSTADSLAIGNDEALVAIPLQIDSNYLWEHELSGTISGTLQLAGVQIVDKDGNILFSRGLDAASYVGPQIPYTIGISDSGTD